MSRFNPALVNRGGGAPLSPRWGARDHPGNPAHPQPRTGAAPSHGKPSPSPAFLGYINVGVFSLHLVFARAPLARRTPSLFTRRRFSMAEKREFSDGRKRGVFRYFSTLSPLPLSWVVSNDACAFPHWRKFSRAENRYGLSIRSGKCRENWTRYVIGKFANAYELSRRNSFPIDAAIISHTIHLYSIGKIRKILIHAI